MSEGLVERLGQLEEAVRRAADVLARLRQENGDLRREVKRLTDERRQVLGQVDAILKDIAKLDLDGETKPDASGAGHPRPDPADERSHSAPLSGHPRPDPADERSHSAPLSGHPRPDPAPGHSLQ